MKRCVLLAAVAALVAIAPAADAKTWSTPSRGGLHQITSVPILPAAWSGVWSYTDSTYDCTGTFKSVDSGLDTLCTGDTYTNSGDGIVFSCDGTFDDNYANVTCSASIPVFDGCTAGYSVTSISTRNGDSYTSTFTGTTTFTGACGPLQNTCILTNRHATRTAPEPPTCATPALPATWGTIKAVYR